MNRHKKLIQNLIKCLYWGKKLKAIGVYKISMIFLLINNHYAKPSKFNQYAMSQILA